MQSIEDTKAHRKRPVLSAAEREVIITAADDEDHVTIFTESKRVITKQILSVARQYGVAPEPLGQGWQVIIPRTTLRIAGPRRKSDRQERHLALLRAVKAARQEARLDAPEPIEMDPPNDPDLKTDPDTGEDHLE
jgi:hypothetical protein